MFDVYAYLFIKLDICNYRDNVNSVWQLTSTSSLALTDQQRQNTRWRSRSFIQHLCYHTDRCQLPDLTAIHTIPPLNLPTFTFSFLRTSYHRTTIFHMLFGLGRMMTPIGFGFTRLKVKVTKVTCVNVYMVFAHYLENCLS